ncbi:MAG TPA: hypothetical protein VKV17_00130 [Bryobacteraceae bacterium]|nr:hypothetical protein [Bryobacteraceae bacterium]
MPDDAIARLARQIDTTTRAERLAVSAAAVAELRRQGAAELHRICAEFVSSVNSRLSEARLELAPPAYRPELFRESGANVLQIGSQGRQLQITFQAGSEPLSTQKFLIPYVLEGEIRTYNQKMLDRLEIRYMMLFYCVESQEACWRYYDWRTAHTGVVGFDLLASLMEPLF